MTHLRTYWSDVIALRLLTLVSHAIFEITYVLVDFALFSVDLLVHNADAIRVWLETPRSQRDRHIPPYE